MVELNLQPRFKIKGKEYKGFNKIYELISRLKSEQFLKAVAVSVAKYIESGKANLNGESLIKAGSASETDLQSAVDNGSANTTIVDPDSYEGDSAYENMVFGGITANGAEISLPDSVNRKRKYHMVRVGNRGFVNFELPDEHPINIVLTIINGFYKKEGDWPTDKTKYFSLTFTEARDALLTLFFQQSDGLKEELGDIIGKEL